MAVRNGVTDVCLASKALPKDELYGLTNQMRRASFSIPSNIAEGQGRATKRDFRHFLTVARGSLLELETQILIAQNLKYLSSGPVEQLLVRSGRVLRLINGLHASLGERGCGGEQNACS
jgi:four helix bundle protein